jgi:hypothetical protein
VRAPNLPRSMRWRARIDSLVGERAPAAIICLAPLPRRGVGDQGGRARCGCAPPTRCSTGRICSKSNCARCSGSTAAGTPVDRLQSTNRTRLLRQLRVPHTHAGSSRRLRGVGMNDTCRICHRRPSYPGTKFLPAIRVSLWPSSTSGKRSLRFAGCGRSSRTTYRPWTREEGEHSIPSSAAYSSPARAQSRH